MTLPLRPAPTLSAAARPYEPLPLPEPPPDLDEAYRSFRNGSQGERDLTERELLGMAMAHPDGLEALRQLEVHEFSMPLNQNVARAILDLADQGQPHDAAAVTAELRRRPLVPDVSAPDDPRSVTNRATQLVDFLDPKIPQRTIDPRTYGLGAWQSTAWACDGRAPMLAREVRSMHRRDVLMGAAHTALREYRHGLAQDPSGRLVEDGLGLVTKELADQLVSVPKELSAWSRPTTEPTTDLRLPSPPSLSPAAQAVLSRSGR